eukprot:CAMPEP_0119119070 /NCGR_PEP_ID=MMETSP1310-20130426/725_1 /TAXON_ID=464262 /ORGANISM="Genus nov. species nov., Strain RCC2339" /LENGTH=84 /DNA_ID=CAMNT_0007108483 /DNA_START=215 /DNA_END=466 /DNA_ORIENTATION=+
MAKVPYCGRHYKEAERNPATLVSETSDTTPSPAAGPSSGSSKNPGKPVSSKNPGQPVSSKNPGQPVSSKNPGQPVSSKNPGQPV